MKSGTVWRTAGLKSIASIDRNMSPCCLVGEGACCQQHNDTLPKLHIMTHVVQQER